MLDGVSRRYGKLPSEMLERELWQFDFDVSVMYRASQIEKGELSDKEIIKERQNKGFESVRNLQAQVAESYHKKGN